MSDWQPIAGAKRDGTKYLLSTTYTKARYRTVVGAWNVKFNEWQSVPGAWPMKPTHFKLLDEPPGES